jgi:hypothetical protein
MMQLSELRNGLFAHSEVPHSCTMDESMEDPVTVRGKFRRYRKMEPVDFRFDGLTAGTVAEQAGRKIILEDVQPLDNRLVLRMKPDWESRMRRNEEPPEVSWDVGELLLEFEDGHTRSRLLRSLFISRYIVPTEGREAAALVVRVWKRSDPTLVEPFEITDIPVPALD